MASEQNDSFERLMAEMDRPAVTYTYGFLNWPSRHPEYQQMGTSDPYMEQGDTFAADDETLQQWYPSTGYTGEMGLLPPSSESENFGQYLGLPVTEPAESQQVGINVPQYMGQGNMFAPNTLQQGSVSPNDYMGQDATLATCTLSLPGEVQNPDLSDVPTPPTTPPVEPVEPAQRKERAPRGGVTRPREYRRSLKSCERCTKNKIKCDDNPEGCQRCKKAGEECWVVDPPMKGRLRRVEANALLNQMEAMYTWSKALEAKCRACGVELPERPEGLPTPENASWLADSSTMN